MTTQTTKSNRITRFTRRLLGLNRHGVIDDDAALGCGCLSAIGIAGLMLGLDSCDNVRKHHPDQASISYSSHPADQVFQDHDGYKVWFTDSSGQYIPVKYYFGHSMKLEESLQVPEEIATHFANINGLSDYTSVVHIFRDLEPGTRGIVHILDFRSINGHDYRNLEIHLAKDGRLSPGTETYGGKHKTHTIITELDDNGIGNEQ